MLINLLNAKTLNIKVLEGKEIQTSNISALADLYCQMYIEGDKRVIQDLVNNKKDNSDKLIRIPFNEIYDDSFYA